MVYDLLSEEERKSLDLILGDLRLLIGKDRISVSEIGDLLQKLKSEEAKHYIESLSIGSKPEPALREFFLARNSPLAKYLFRELSPEIRIIHDEAKGFIDYVIADKDTGRTIRLELKALFEAKFETGKTRALRELRQVPLNPDAHSKQVQKYLSDENAQYVILTNLRDWYFYSKITFPNVKPFAKLTLDELLQRLEPIGNLFELLVRLEHESVKEELGERFFEDLKRWVGELSKVQFEGDEKTKLELIITLINKFIFIQTLDDYGVIEFNWIKNTWDRINERWRSKGLEEVIKRFLAEVDEWFYSYYDTELFKITIFNYVKKTPENIQVFYNALKNVLGFAEIPVRGITHYNFRHIDEDIFGRAYETFLAEARKEKGIYYTPKYVTQYIVDNTVGRIFDEALEEVKSKLESDRLDEALESIKKFTSIKVLDPACGSGSFLVKAFRVIVERYRRLGELIDKAKEKIGGWKTLDPRSREPVEKLEELKKSLGLNNDVALFAKILLRHIYGVDLDERAVEVAKVNLWLEAIKLSPKTFRYEKLGNITHALPNLDLNLRVGDSLVGYAGEAELVLKTLSTSYNSDLLEITTLRSKYIENPGSTDYVDEIKKTMESIRKTLDDMFKKHLEGEKIPTEILNQTKPLYWIIDFWHVFFDEKGNPLPMEERGFDVVIGNPPYIENKKIKEELKGYLRMHYKSAYKLFDYAVPFIERGYKLLKPGGRLGYIITNKFMITDYGVAIRSILLKETTIEEILDVSHLPVFKGVAAYPVIVIFRKTPPSERHEIRIASEIDSEEEIRTGKLPFINIPQTTFLKIDKYIISIAKPSTLTLLEKIKNQNVEYLKNIGEFGYRVLEFTDWKKLLAYVVSSEPTRSHLKFIATTNIEPYYINWDREITVSNNKFKNAYLVKPEFIDEEKWNFLASPKIVIREVAKSVTAALDEKGEYGYLYGVYSIHNINKYEPHFIVAVLNSSVIDFYYKSLYESSHMAGNYLNFHESYLASIPIVSISIEQQNRIAELVKRIELLKRCRTMCLKYWREWSSRLKNHEYSLSMILANDMESITRGNLNSTWTSKASFYPTGQKLKEIAIKRYKEFHVVGDDKNNIIRIYGLDENSVEELVYEMEFVNRELMLHVYCSLVDTLESKAKIDTLGDLLEKTMVPVVRGGRFLGELTQNIVRKAIEDFKKWLESEKIQGVDPDIVVIDSEIDDLVARVDAYVFKLYGLTSDEARTILKSLGKPQSYIEKTLRYYTGL
jgi:type I restriction-modification system DNA methylase subunit